MTDRKRSGRIARSASALVLSAAAFAATAWALLLSALCIGSACPERLRVTWWAWLALLAAVAGTVLALRESTARPGRLLLVLPLVVAVVATFAGA